MIIQSERSPESQDIVCYRIIVRGRVQGVGFRWFVVRRANDLGVTGWVRNTPGGRSVEALAQGTVADLNEFMEKTMRVGPGGAVVAEMSVTDEPVDDERELFVVLPAGDPP